MFITSTGLHAAPLKILTTGKYVISESINTINPITRKPQLITIIEELDIVVHKKMLTITPKDKNNKYFTKAQGFINNNGEIQFGFTIVDGEKIFSVNYSGEPTSKGYIQGKLISIYAKSKGLITGDWTMKKVNGDIKKRINQFPHIRNP